MANDKGTKAAAAPAIDTSDWQKEKVGFDPYWTPDTGKTLIATLIGRDDRAKDFVRYQFMSATDLECQRGPGDAEKEGHEKVTVKAGDTFNVSVYHALEEPFDRFIAFAEDTGKAVTIKLTCTGEKPTTAGKTVWLWDCLVPPAIKAALNAWRKEHAPKGLAAGNAAREQLAQ